jgi:hypothetical protein
MAMLLTPAAFPSSLASFRCVKKGSAGRGVALALLFGARLTVTQTLWGVAIAGVGEALGMREAARYLSLAGGAVAYVFGLSMLALVSVPVPSVPWIDHGQWPAKPFGVRGRVLHGLTAGQHGPLLS